LLLANVKKKILKEFRKNKQQVKERLDSLKNWMKEQARFCKAAMIQRVPKVAAETLRLLDQQKLLGRNVSIVGTSRKKYIRCRITFRFRCRVRKELIGGRRNSIFSDAGSTPAASTAKEKNEYV